MWFLSFCKSLFSLSCFACKVFRRTSLGSRGSQYVIPWLSKSWNKRTSWIFVTFSNEKHIQTRLFQFVSGRGKALHLFESLSWHRAFRCLRYQSWAMPSCYNTKTQNTDSPHVVFSGPDSSSQDCWQFGEQEWFNLQAQQTNRGHPSPITLPIQSQTMPTVLAKTGHNKIDDEFELTPLEKPLVRRIPNLRETSTSCFKLR